MGLALACRGGPARRPIEAEDATMFAITGLYAAALTALMMVLGGRVSLMRLATGVSLGDGGKPALTERIRVHANLIENLPMAVILMGIAEAQGAAAGYLHTMGAILLISRIAHPFGISSTNGRLIARPLAATGTAIALLMGIGFIAWKAFAA
jgi:uncharacterized membrane protein YecN with MAPEG domain